MHKILAYIIIISFLFLTKGFSEKINDIKVSGNKRISDQTVLVLGDLAVGKDLSTSELNDSLKKLYNSNFFSDVKIKFDNGILKIDLVENPIIEDIEITGIKNKTFIEDLYENMTLKNRMSYSQELLKRDIDLIKNILKTSGFYFASIETSVIQNEELNSIANSTNAYFGTFGASSISSQNDQSECAMRRGYRRPPFLTIGVSCS